MSARSYFHGALLAALALASCGGRSSPRALTDGDGGADAESPGNTTVDEACTRVCECGPENFGNCMMDCLQAADVMESSQACWDCVAARECIDFGAPYCQGECSQGRWPYI